jgi:hypothetical protein
MALREIGQNAELRDVLQLDYLRDFESVWLLMTYEQRVAIEAEINCRLDELVHNPNPNWGSVTNTSIEGGRTNPATGIRGDWVDTVFQPILEACGFNEERAGMFYGNIWKRVIIDRPELWIGIRSDPTFRRRAITLQGKTYFLNGIT